MVVAGPVTLNNVTALLEEGLIHVRAGARTVDLSQVSELDSSLLAAILAWMRESRRSNSKLSVEHLPKDLETLAQLYGIEKLLRPASAA
jgi:phospholipid transport system transporter-binding protein